MSLIKRSKKTEVQRLKEFGLVMCTATTILSGIFTWKEKPAVALTMSLLAGFFLILGIYSPRVLAPIEKYWLLLGEKMSVVMSTVIVTLTFYLLIVPLGLLMRLFRADLLHLKIQPDAKSYWQDVEEDGPSTRPFTPY